MIHPKALNPEALNPKALNRSPDDFRVLRLIFSLVVCFHCILGLGFRVWGLGFTSKELIVREGHRLLEDPIIRSLEA